MRARSGLVAALWLALSLSGARVVDADRSYPAEAERRNERASRFYKAGKYEDALQLYQAAYEMDALPRYLFNIGLAREKTFDYEGCAVTLRRFLDQTEGDATYSDLRTRAADRMARCRERVEIPVNITSMPPFAAILIGPEGQRRLRGRTPKRLELAPGTYEISVEITGFVGQTRVVEVKLGERPDVDFVLDKVSQLKVEVDPSGATVRIDEQVEENAPLSLEVLPGMHRIQVTKDGYEPMDRLVRVDSGEQVSLVLTLKALQKLRTVDIESAVPAVVWIDGRQLGTTPIEHQLQPGSHDLEVTAPGRIPYSSAIKIPDRDARLVVDLAPRRTRRQKAIFWTAVGGAGVACIISGIYGALMLKDQARFDDAQTPELRDSVLGNARRADLWLGTALVLGGSAFVYRYVTRPLPSRARIVR